MEDHFIDYIDSYYFKKIDSFFLVFFLKEGAKLSLLNHYAKNVCWCFDFQI
jgi:hypothetical protein